MKSVHWDKFASIDEYHDEILSPFSKGVKNPVYSIINQLKGTNRKTVLEVGCGLGMLLPRLSKKFKRVVAVDISKKMINHAKLKNESLNNVEYHVLDVKNLHRLNEKFDVVITINSIVMPNIPKVNYSLKKINKVLKNNGLLIGVFPSFDSYVYHAMILFDKEFEKSKNRAKARRATNRITSRRHHDYCYGFFFNDLVTDKQKHYYGFELLYRLKKAGFKDIKLSKLNYPWELIIWDPNPSRYKGEIYDELWDWVVTAKKITA